MSVLFPELHGPVETPAWTRTVPIDPKPTTSPSGPKTEPTKNDIVDAGADGLDVLERILGLPGPFTAGDPVRIIGATVHPDDRIELRLDGEATGLVPIWLAPGDIEKAFAKTPSLSLWYHTDPALPIHSVLAKYIASRLQRVPIDAMLRGLRADPEAKARPRPDSLEAYEIGSSINHSYAHSSTWRNFVEGQNFFRGIGGGRFEGRVVSVHHADVECSQNTPPAKGNPVHFFSHFHPEVRGDSDAEAEDGPTSLVTDMNDREVVKGADSKLDAMLDQVAARKRPPEMLMLMSSCLSKVTGDDLGAVAERFKRKVRIPVLDIGNPDTPMHAAILQMIRASGFDAVPRRPGSVNLIGLPKIEGNAELLQGLEDAGIPVHCTLLPDVNLESLKTFRAADVQVLYPWSWNDEVYALLKEKSGIPAICPPAPFGMENSIAWHVAVAGAVGAGEAMTSALAPRIEQLAPRWEALRKRAGCCALGIIGDDDTLTRLSDGTRMLGISVVELLHEMGFHVEVLRYLPPRERETPCPVKGERVVVRRFSTPDVLEALLRTSRAGAFYSEYFFDRRLTRTGHTIFSLEQFGMGLGGAVRTLERLVRRAEMSFYRLHGARLGTAFFDATTGGG